MSVCVSHLCSSPANRLVFVPRKVINLWLFGEKFLGLIRGLSKNSVHHDDQLDNTKMLVISNYFEQLFV